MDIAYHILITWYASSSQTQIEKLCKLREIYYAMGYAKDFDMYLADSKFELPKMKKGGKAKQTPIMGVSALSRQDSFSPSSQVSSGPIGENTVGKRILDANGDQTTQKNSRTVTFELSQVPGNKRFIYNLPTTTDIK